MIPVPVVSRVYRSTTANTFAMTRACSQCGRTSPAKVSAYAVGEAETMLPLHDRSDTARARALEGLRPAAEHSLALAACPHCKAREPAAERTVRRAAISASALTSRAVIPGTLAAVTFMLAAVAVVADQHFVGGALAILVGIALTAIWWRLARSALRERLARARDMADATVMWPGHESLEPPLAPPPAIPRPASNGWPFA